MAEYTVCDDCGLRYRPTEHGCPRCEDVIPVSLARAAVEAVSRPLPDAERIAEKCADAYWHSDNWSCGESREGLADVIVRILREEGMAQ